MHMGMTYTCVIAFVEQANKKEKKKITFVL